MAKRSLTQEQVEEYRQQLLAKHDSELRKLLEPGEALQGVAMARIGTSIKEPPMRYLPEGDQVSDWLERFGRAGVAVQFGPGNALSRVADFLLREKPKISGGWESQAGQFVILVAAAAKRDWTIPRDLSLVATGRRVLLMTSPGLYGLRPFKSLIEYTPGAIAVRPGWQLKPGDNEVDVGFADGSWLSLTAELPAGPALIAQLLGSPVQTA
jgi:hypothetical protein